MSGPRMCLALTALSLAGFFPPAPEPGLKIVHHQTFPDTRVETTEYIQADRSRTEWRVAVGGGGKDGEQSAGSVPHLRSARITRCDLRKAIVLSYDDRTYMADHFVEHQVTASRRLWPPASTLRAAEAPPELLVEITTVQTGERKTLFGQAARRVITTRRDIPREPAGGSPAETETDGWYIDLQARPSCEQNGLAAVGAVLVGRIGTGGRMPTVGFKEIGAPERGYPVELKITRRVPGPPGSADHTVVTHRTVTELSRGPLDPALFDIPPGFRPAGGPLAGLAERWSRAWHATKAIVTAWWR